MLLNHTTAAPDDASAADLSDFEEASEPGGSGQLGERAADGLATSGSRARPGHRGKSMTVEKPTTRRAVLAAAVTLPAVAALPAPKASAATETAWRRIAKSLGCVENAADALARARAAGLDPRRCVGVTFYLRGHPESDMPWLHFGDKYPGDVIASPRGGVRPYQGLGQ